MEEKRVWLEAAVGGVYRDDEEEMNKMKNKLQKRKLKSAESTEDLLNWSDHGSVC